MLLELHFVYFFVLTVGETETLKKTCTRTQDMVPLRHQCCHSKLLENYNTELFIDDLIFALVLKQIPPSTLSNLGSDNLCPTYTPNNISNILVPNLKYQYLSTCYESLFLPLLINVSFFSNEQLFLCPL